MGLPPLLRVLLPLELHLEREDQNLNMLKSEIGMIQTKDEVNSIPALWDEGHTDPARHGVMRVKVQAILLTGQALT